MQVCSAMVDFPHKIVAPRRPTHLISRNRLTTLLEQIAERNLITLTAPAGYGKTSLLIDFADAATLPVCWYTLDRSDEDPWEFLSYLTAAIEQKFPSATQRTTTLLASRGSTNLSAVATSLLRDIYAIGNELVIIIDDWHLVDHVTDISEFISQLLARCPNCHLILASRIYPGIPDMMLLVARRQMSGLDEEELRFTPNEAAAVLEAERRKPIPYEQIEEITVQSNGWITGILLLSQTSNTALLVHLGKQAERQVYRFLAEQVLDRQPPPIQSFLLGSALLDELTPERCDEILEYNDSMQILETLLRQHIFITEVRPGVLRYHPLFREFLLGYYRQSSPQSYRATALRVARHYAARKQWSLAFDACIAADDLQTAKDIMRQGGEQLYAVGRLETLERWFAVIPLEELDVLLLRLKARVLLNREAVHEAKVLAELASSRMRPDERALALLLHSEIARIGGQYDQALEYGEEALRSATEPSQQTQALRMIAICHQRLGYTNQSIIDLQKALELEHQCGDLHMVAHIQHSLGVCYEEIGQLHRAEEYYSQADAYWNTVSNISQRAMSLNSKGVVQHLAGNYRAAYQTLTQALHFAEEAAVSRHQATVQASLGDLYTDLQLWDKARIAYDNARLEGSSAFLLNYLDLAQIRLLLRQRLYSAAEYAIDHLPSRTRERYLASVLLLRAVIANGLHNWQQATVFAQQALEAFKQNETPMEMARVYLIQAQIALKSPDANDATLVKHLEHAAQIADQLGHDAFLVVETLTARDLLRRAAASDWQRANDWLHRHENVTLAAQSIAQDDQRPLLVVRTLGAEHVLLDGKLANIGWFKAREVLYFLLAHREGATPEALREAIWPDLSPSRSRDALKSAIYQLRTALPRELIELHGRQRYQINRNVVQLNYDVERFHDQLDHVSDGIEAYYTAFDLYHGPYLHQSENAWSSALRAYLEQRYLQALQSVAKACTQQSFYTDALNLYQRILTLTPLDEVAHAGIMRCQVALGNRAAAIEQYHNLRRILDEELGINPEPDSEAEQIYRQILAAS